MVDRCGDACADGVHNTGRPREATRTQLPSISMCYILVHYDICTAVLPQVQIDGPLGKDGYVVDFSVLKKAVRSVCKTMDEKTLVPLFSTRLGVSRLPSAPELASGQQLSPLLPSQAGVATHAELPHLVLTLPEGGVFVIPEGDCCLLPVRNVSVEELAVHIAQHVVQLLPLAELLHRGVQSLQVGVQETSNQKATFRIELSKFLGLSGGDVAHGNEK